MTGPEHDHEGALAMFGVCPVCETAPAADPTEPGPDFDGDTYERPLDRLRLSGQLGRVMGTMEDGRWRTLAELSAATGDPEASVSARLRDLRKRKFGGRVVEARRRGDPTRGAWEYRLAAE